jgi:hypothetical protein
MSKYVIDGFSRSVFELLAPRCATVLLGPWPQPGPTVFAITVACGCAVYEFEFCSNTRNPFPPIVRPDRSNTFWIVPGLPALLPSMEIR